MPNSCSEVVGKLPTICFRTPIAVEIFLIIFKGKVKPRLEPLWKFQWGNLRVNSQLWEDLGALRFDLHLIFKSVKRMICLWLAFHSNLVDLVRELIIWVYRRLFWRWKLFLILIVVKRKWRGQHVCGEPFFIYLFLFLDISWEEILPEIALITHSKLREIILLGLNRFNVHLNYIGRTRW